ncbi:family 20 glycosylhydrolase [Algibacillus agarilyticus]|uniref:family 20 glycosylhydrolase n=1 Tax=Algibacillus agarilyticus TaxID=2234133 RepID=UPI001E2C53D4|nr:family 20 glycosylhydrolase [Algibacillus agarilyticus]
MSVKFAWLSAHDLIRFLFPMFSSMTKIRLTPVKWVATFLTPIIARCTSQLLRIVFSLAGAFLISGCGADNDHSQSNSGQQVAPLFLATATQQDIDDIAQHLQVTYQQIDNSPSAECDPDIENGSCFRVDLLLTAPNAIKVKDWQIYFSQITPIQKSVSNDFTITHINGDLHQINLSDKFTGFAAGEQKVITFYANFWSLSETDALPNYIVASAQHKNELTPAIEPRVIKSTQVKIDPETGLEILPYVAEFTDEEKQFKRTADDQTKWLTAERLYERNLTYDFSAFTQVSPLNKTIQQQIIPTPTQVKFSKAGTVLDTSVGLKVNYHGLQAINEHNVNHMPADIQAALSRLAALGLMQKPNGGVPLNIVVNPSQQEQDAKPLGSYQLRIQAEQITITADDPSGAFYGLQSLASLYRLDSQQLPIGDIIDQPHYEFRGVLVDVARNFRDKGFILKLLDQMSAYKLNKLHLHLGDDEGWRLEIPSLPELTELSSKRCFDLKEQYCLMPQLGAGLDPTSEVNGYYSVADYQEILQAASARHIQVIPSLDMPGHSRAAVKAMTARYNKYMAQEDKEKAEQYLLHDPLDTTRYSSVQHYNDNTINVCLASSYAFVAEVMQQVKLIHQQAGQPLTRYHIGADETAGAWVSSPACHQFLATNEEGITEVSQLGGYFIERVANLLASMDIETAAWSDGLSHTRQTKMPAVVQANAWSLLMWDGHHSAHELANRNWQVVLSTPDVLYFDFPYEADPKEHGYYWASRHINSEKIFQFMPDNLPIHAEFWLDREDKPYVANDTLKADKTGKLISQPLEQGRQFAGIQGQLWSENTRTNQTAEYKLFPRLLSLAERAWHQAKWAVPYDHKGFVYSQNTERFNQTLQAQRDQKWQLFAATLGLKEFAKLERAGVHYRLPTVGAKIINETLFANIAYPGLAIEYQIDDGEWLTYHTPVKITGDVWVRTKTQDGQRFGRKLRVTSP